MTINAEYKSKFAAFYRHLMTSLDERISWEAINNTQTTIRSRKTAFKFTFCFNILDISMIDSIDIDVYYNENIPLAICLSFLQIHLSNCEKIYLFIESLHNYGQL